MKKLTALVICSIFVFSSICINTNAAVSNLPEMTDWQFQQAIDAYAGLTDDQKDIANFLTGSQGYAFAGIAQSNLNSNFSSYNDAINYVKNFGAKFWNELSDIDRSAEAALYKRREQLQGVKNDLSNFLGNAVTYAKSRSESFSAWLGNVGIDYNSSSEFRIQFGKDQAQDNIEYFGDQGLYRWQITSNVLTPSNFDFTYITRGMNGTDTQTYYSYLNQMSGKQVRANGSGANYIASSYGFDTYCNIFYNTSNNTIYLCDNNGNMAQTFSAQLVFYLYDFSGWHVVGYNDSSSFTPQVMSASNYSSFQSIIDALESNFKLLLSSSNVSDLCWSDFLQGMYVGSSWNDKAPWTVDYDLNLSSTSQYVTVNAPTNVIYIDLNGFMRDLYDNPTIIYNYVVNNSIDGNGDPVDPSGFEPVSKYPGIPDSGINIGLEFFKFNGMNPLFGQNGYIAVLWNNTKGLVTYLASVLSMLTFDGGNSPALVIYGAIAVGVIGGIFSKFLL